MRKVEVRGEDFEDLHAGSICSTELFPCRAGLFQIRVFLEAS